MVVLVVGSGMLEKVKGRSGKGKDLVVVVLKKEVSLNSGVMCVVCLSGSSVAAISLGHNNSLRDRYRIIITIIIIRGE
jgi:hypothetical protein